MDVRVEMYRIPLDCINSPDLTMHFRIDQIEMETVLDWVGFGFNNDLKQSFCFIVSF